MQIIYSNILLNLSQHSNRSYYANVKLSIHSDISCYANLQEKLSHHSMPGNFLARSAYQNDQHEYFVADIQNIIYLSTFLFSPDNNFVPDNG